MFGADPNHLDRGQRPKAIGPTLDEMPILNFNDHKLGQGCNNFKDRKPI